MKGLEKPIQVTKSFLPPIEDYIDKLKIIWENDWLTNNGPLHNELEGKISDYLKVNETTLFVNGHSALCTALKALNIKGEVITTPFTFASTTHAIVSNGLKPIFCDINMDNFTIDVNEIEKLITKDTSAIVPVHVFGYPCNVKEIDRIAKKHNLKVIYDAAHVFGVEINGHGIGEFGDISMFSLHATKVYNSIEGGLLACKEEALVEKFNILKNFGITGQESVGYVGMNAKMNEFQAAMGLANLKYLDDQIEKRKLIAEAYRKSLKQIKGIKYLDDMENVKHNYAYFPIIIDEKITGITRDKLNEELKTYNIYTRKYFYPLTSDFDCYKNEFDSGDLKNAKYVANRVLTLPMYGELKIEEAVTISDIIKEIIERKGSEK
ncbi:MAG: DegT/DnrJ/EryC1/StrS family aminotransferase [Clostridium sp.]|uniref:DegT/DnrJ/EryC1/StrS family aminotransferase n=1 Tax=Clostridium sp. TaxID=1506 RepID=UPI003F3EDE71